MKLRHSLIGIILFFILPGFGPGQDRNQPTPNDFWGRYGLIVERNIFSRSRGMRRPPPTDRVEIRPAPVVGKSFVLRGITHWDNEFIAFVENTRYAETRMYRLGDVVAEAKIKNITLDQLVLEKGTETVNIEIGQDLSGGIYVAPPTLDEIISQPATGMGSAQTEATVAEVNDTEPSEATPAESVDEDEILKRLMEQRSKELQN
jgi:hypothetical protein